MFEIGYKNTDNSFEYISDYSYSYDVLILILSNKLIV